MVIELLVLGLVWLTGEASSASPPIAKPGCLDTCGNISIPYPFGIGANCYANHRFAITCDNSSKPFLTNSLLEVLHIDAWGDGNSSGAVLINHPVLAYDCPDGTKDHRLVNLSSHFWFSKSYNVFKVTGCNNLALMMNQDQQIIGGCASICNPNISTDGGRSCYGINCCRTSIPPSLNFINTSLSRFINDSKTNECNYAFITYSSISIDASNTSLINDIQGMQPVFDAWLEWGMPGESSEYTPAHGYCWPTINYTYACQCNFTGGFPYVSNPYLSDGCPGPLADKKKITIIGMPLLSHKCGHPNRVKTICCTKLRPKLRH